MAALGEAARAMLTAQFRKALDDAASLDDGSVAGARKATDASYQCAAIAARATEAFRRIEDGKDAD